MANYSDKVIKSLEPDKIKYIKEWNKKFTSKFDEDDIETVLRLSDIIDDLWKRTVKLRKKLRKQPPSRLVYMDMRTMILKITQQFVRKMLFIKNCLNQNI